jgi:hypothetical protein
MEVESEEGKGTTFSIIIPIMVKGKNNGWIRRTDKQIKL